ncbi:MAG: ATP-grasp domain-containing protein [Vulcanimicrobiota bacterium]
MNTPTVLCLAGYFKGLQLVRSYKQLGCRVVVITASHLQDRPWPRELIDELHFVESMDEDPDELLRAVAYLAREQRFDIVTPLEEYMLQPAALVRAHLGCAGMDEAVARRVRDKLTMRLAAQRAGLPTPRFVGLAHHPAVAHFLEEVPAPWILKPRLEGGSVQMKKLHTAQDAWQQIDDLGDKQSWFLLEEFVSGRVCHVDSIYQQGKVLFANPSCYLTPPFSVWHGGGVFGSRTVNRKSSIGKSLLKENERAVAAMGLQTGVAHTEFIVDENDRPYFLELGARIPGAHLDRLLKEASGIDIALEQCRLAVGALNKREYKVPKATFQAAGLLLCLAHDKDPDLSSFDDPEVVWRLAEDYHAGLLFKGEEKRVEEILHQYAERLQDKFLAVLPPSDKPA